MCESWSLQHSCSVQALPTQPKVNTLAKSLLQTPIDCLQEIQQELNYARELYAANPEWPVLDVTFR